MFSWPMRRWILKSLLQIEAVLTWARLTRLNFALGSYEKFQPGFWYEKRPKIVGKSSGAKFEKQSKRGKTQTF